MRGARGPLAALRDFVTNFLTMFVDVRLPTFEITQQQHGNRGISGQGYLRAIGAMALPPVFPSRPRRALGGSSSLQAARHNRWL